MSKRIPSYGFRKEHPLWWVQYKRLSTEIKNYGTVPFTCNSLRCGPLWLHWHKYENKRHIRSASLFGVPIPFLPYKDI